MRYFVIFSLALHAALFAAWPSHDLPAHMGGPIVVSLLIKDDIASQEPLAPKHAVKQPAKNFHADRPVKNSTAPAQIDTTTSTDKSVTDNSATDNSVTKQSASPGDSMQTAQASSQAVTGSQIEAYLRQAFIPYFTYPELAREKGWQGTVELAVNIDGQGVLTKARIVHSSGYGVLDHAALDSIRQVKSLPNALQWLNNPGFEVNFPVQYQLIDI